VKEGNSEVILCERGIKTFETATRFTLDIRAIPVLKQETHLPVIVDPSHPAGRRDLVLPLARAAVAPGADGVIVDVHPRREAVRWLGVTVEAIAGEGLGGQGAGLGGLRAGGVDCRNAGTLMRLLSGVLAGQEGEFTLTGDESLTPRPMERVAAPLRRMGAEVATTDGHAPLVVRGTGALRGIEIEPEVASAQVKSAILLAGLNADGPTTVVERIPTRDHTERMLEAAGVRLRRSANSARVEPAGALRLGEVDVPGDFSSAAPLLVAAALVPGSDLTIHDLGVNPRRTGLLDVLERMGARISVFERRRAGGEPVASVQVQPGELIATEIGADEVPSLVDELP